MTDTVPLSMLVPETTVGLGVIWREESGSYGAAWRDTVDRVPMPRRESANVLRQLADALDAEADRIEAEV